MSDTKVGHVHKAICEIKKELDAHGGITKDRTAPKEIGGYAFRGIDDADNVLCGLTAKHGIVLYPRVVGKKVEVQVDAKGRLQKHIELTLEMDIVSMVDGSSHTVRTEGEGIDTGDKGTGKAFSNARKMAVFGVFQIPTHGENVEEYPVQVAPPRVAPVPVPTKPEPVAVVHEAPSEPEQEQEPAAAKPGPAKAKRTRAPKEIPIPAEGTPVENPAALKDTIAEVNTFPLLFACAQDADATDEPGRTELFTAIKARTIQLFGDAKSLEDVKEGMPLVKAFGAPETLMRAYNEAYARFRQ